MPGYSKDENSLGCKLVTSFVNNQLHGLPSVMASVLLFDGDTGKMKVVMEGNTITGRRTAAASVVATKYLHQGPKEVLAILGAGTQAKTHALALQHTFNFKEIRVWNHRREGAVKLSSELPFPCKVAVTNQDCVRNADVICTTTYAVEPILKAEWVKLGAHINAIGAGIVHHSEIEEELYRKSLIVVDHYESAEKELKGLKEIGFAFWSEIGEIISGVKKAPPADSITIFHSLGKPIDIDEFEMYTKRRLICTCLYDWYFMPVTVHKLLLHGPEIVKNALVPIGQLWEDAQEANHKYFRSYREQHSRKTSRIDNSRDIFNNLLINSDPVISNLQPKFSSFVKSKMS